MIITKTKRKILIVKLEVTKHERFKPFEIRLPSNVKMVTGILVTASGSRTSGMLSLQANGKADVFHVTQVLEDGIELSDEALLNIEDAQFDSDKAWVTGYVPKMRTVHVEGDTTIINAWFKGEAFLHPFVIRVYVECELAEELEEVIADEKVFTERRSKADATEDWLAPMEIHL
jgi:hypothetical protein